MSIRRFAAALGGAALLAALVTPGSAASQGADVAAQPGAAPVAAAVPAATAPEVAAVGTYIASGSVFRLDVSYVCPTKNTGSVSIEAHQNVGGGFVANGYGYSRTSITCNGTKQTVRITVAPQSERGFRRGPAYVIADLGTCAPNSEVCGPLSAERTVAIR